MSPQLKRVWRRHVSVMGIAMTAALILLVGLVVRVSATNDENHIEEVMAGANGNSKIQFIVMREQGGGNCWGPQGSEPQSRTMMVSFDASGREIGKFKFPNNPGNTTSCSIGNVPVLLATQEFANLPGAPTPDFIMPPLLNPLAGKVCFTNNLQNPAAFPRNDCLSYGAFTGSTSGDINFGPPAAALPIMNTVSLRLPNSATRFGSSPNTSFLITATPTPTNSSGATFTIPVAPLRVQGETVFTKEIFGGNGRTCATCHVASANFGMTPANVQSRFATVGTTFDPLFIGELKPSAFDDGFDFNLNTLDLTVAVASNKPCSGDLRGIITGSISGRANVLTRVSGTRYLVQGGANPPLAGTVSDTHACSATVASLTAGDLAKPELPLPSVFGLEFPRLMRTSSDPITFPQGRALVLENVDGTGPPLSPHVFRKSPHLLNLSRTAPFGFSGDVPNLQAFLQGAINQHYPRSMARNSAGANPDFRLPTADELRAAEAFMLAQEFPAGNDPNKFDLDRFATTAAQRRGRALFFGSAKCSQCHGGPVLAATTVSIQGKAVGINAAFNTGVVNQPINGAGADNLPAEALGEREFSVPQLFNVKNLGPLFHDASVPDVAGAVNFYASGQFNGSPAGLAIGGILLGNPEKADLVAFLEALAPRPYTLSTRVVRFGTQDKSAGPTAALGITITNTSGAPITFSTPACTLTGTNPGEFNITNCPLDTPLAAGEARTITANFDPSVNGVADTAILEINAPDPSGVDLFGTAATLVGLAPTVSAIAPTSGSTLGGTAITVTGTNFALGTTVAIGGVDAGSVVFVNTTTMTASTGPHAAGLVNVVVTNPDAQTASLTNAFTYVAPPVVTSIAPQQGSIDGGTAVTITGSEFVPGVTVTIGGVAATNVVVVNGTTMTAVTAAHAAGPADVKVTNPSTLLSDTLVSGFTFSVLLPPPTISTISPTTGATFGGTAVTILGTNFAPGATVSIGGVAATNVSVVSPTVITATTGGHAVGLADVVVINVDSGLAIAASRFTYQLRSTNDAFGNRFPITGGGALTSTGSNVGATAEAGEPADDFPGFGTARSVWWTWTAPCSFTVTSPNAFIDTAGSSFDTVLSVFTGSGFPLALFANDDDNGGTVTSKVPTGDTSLSVTAGTAFQIRVRGVNSTDTGTIVLHLTSPCAASNAPMVSSITPTTGSSVGGTIVTIAGTNFVAGATVFIGGVPATVVSAPATSITAITPAHVPGPVDVVVKNPDLQSGTLLNGFTVFAVPPALTAVNPTAGPTGTSPSIALTGTNFVPGMTVDAGSGITVSNVVVGSSTLATATFAIASNATLGPRSVSVTTPGGTSGTVTFTVVAVPTLTGLSPTEALRATAPTVTLTGTNFVAGMTVNAGSGITVNNIVVGTPTSATATFTIAANAPVGTRNVTVTTSGGTTGSVAFTVLLQAPTLTDITPNVGVPGQSVSVTLTGTSFVAGSTVDVGTGITVSNVVLNLISEASATATFTVAPGAALGPRNVTVTNAAGTSSAVIFSVVDPFPDLTSGSAHTGNFGAGFNENYVLTVSNQGTAATTDTITVTDTLPASMTFVSGSGTGWTCSGAQTVTCTRASALAVGASTTINLVVAVASSATSGAVTNAVTVSTAGDLIPSNNGGTDPTNVVATPTPSFSFGAGPLLPGQQANVGVNLAASFPHDVTGTVTMNFTSNAAIPLDDPAIQFASGGRLATFVIAANTVQAKFGSSASAGPIFFQTGTVSGTFTFIGFMQAGTAVKTFLPSGPNLSIPKQAPSIQKVETSTQNGFAALISLQSTLREVTQMSLTFNTTPAVKLSCGNVAGCSVSGSTITFDVKSLFDNWFTNDTTFGSLSTLRLPLTISGTVHGTVTVTLRNSMGASNTMSFSLQ